MPRDYTLAGLIDRRARLDGEAIALRKRLDEIGAALVRIDAAIGVFDAQVNPNGIRAKRHRGPNAVRPGVWSRGALDALRRAGGLVTTAAVVDAVMVAAGFDPQDKAIRRLATKRVTHSLGEFRAKGLVRSERTEGQTVLWTVIR